MILTPRFVYIHLPKTGGTFVSTVLERLMKPPRPRNWPERVVGRIRKRIRGRAWVDTNKHGPCSEIPEPYRGLPIAACIRDPFDRYVSQYEFGWWRTHRQPWIDWDGIRERHPSFPDLTFEEFLEEASTGFHRLGGSPLPPEDALGFHSEQFVRYFFRDPAGTWPRIDDAYIEGRRWEEDLFPVRFLRQESLNVDLHDFLLEVGFLPGEVAFVLEQGRILPEGSSRKGDRHWSDYYTPEMRARIGRRERLFLAIFPEYGGP